MEYFIYDLNDGFINVGKDKLFVRTWQPEEKNDDLLDKSPIVLFHDSLGCVDLWRSFPAALSNATQRRVIAYDRFGYGKSAANPNEQSLDFVSKEADVYFPVLREQLHIDKFIAFGHSVGGGMAVHCAASFKGQCEALITESAQSFVEDRTLEGIREAKVMFSDASNVERLKKYHGEKTSWVLNAWMETWLSPEFSSWNLEEVLPRVQCPLLAIHGSEDEYGSTRHPQLICELAGGRSTLKILPGFKHVPHREEEKTVVELAANFIDDTLV